MNSRPAEKIDNNDGQTETPRSKTVSTINSTDALAMVEHSSELTLSITTLSEQNSSAALRLLVLIRISFYWWKCPKYRLMICSIFSKKDFG